MALPDLTGINIQDSYQRLLQTNGTQFFDGTGSLVDLGGSSTFPYTGDAVINGTLNVTTNFTASGLNYPNTDGTNGQVVTTDGAGNLSFSDFSADDAEAIHIPVKNTSGVTITKGTPVYITGNVGNSERLEIAAADALDPATMPAVGLLESDLSNNDQGFVAQGGYLRGLVTNLIDGVSTNSNDTIYVKAGGGLTVTKPTGSALIQNIAKVARSHDLAGSVIVSSILRTNDIPNLPTGYTWVGDGNGVATATPTSSIGGSSGTTFPYSGSAEITGSLTVIGPLTITGSQLITDDITSSGTLRAKVKSFDIVHPTKPGKRLVYGVMEGPEHGVYCRGRSQELKVKLPPEWSKLVVPSTITVQITSAGKFQPIYFEKFISNWLYFGCDSEEIKEFDFFWEIKGARADVPKLKTTQ